ncbi:FtsX-like permease family protein [Solitalea koreensis]|uniref:Lipoprotein-releasing system permease protein n=1 Tax=Solitalea koreensis TaxID=543615 RepID=A0A521EF43_9SPHI|nr:FtsX-like permease family protein [Solitalea koreensis]SMO82546.1 lipoprotein-releasing system permease protein [Solitalea koreensis]
MNLALYIAKRYLFSKKSTNAINIISGISMLGIMIGSAALIIILSVFNGFEELVLSLYNKFTPDIKIETKVGKTFDPRTAPFSEIKKMKQVAYYVESLEEKALLRNNNSQYIATIKGVSDDFLKTHALDSMILRGKLALHEGSREVAIVGSGVEYFLGLDVKNSQQPVSVFSPKKKIASTINPGANLNRKEIFVSGVFQVQQDFDDKYMLTPISFARDLMDEPNLLSAVEIYATKGTSISRLKTQLSALLGDRFTVKDRVEQNQLLYKILNSEKWAVYLILTFVLLIAICNIIGSLTMLVIDKKKDVAVLLSMGADSWLIRRIFLLEGMLIALAGSILGILLGWIFCLLQQKYGLIKLSQSGTFIMENYPVSIRYIDFLLVFGTVFIISFAASWFASANSVRNFSSVREDLNEQ